MAVAHLRLGPVEEEGRVLAIAFWPDPKALGTKAQMALLTGDPAALTPEHFPEQSVAARGLTGLERLLYPADPLPADPCALIRATTADLARMAAGIEADWRGGYADVLLTAGEPGNTISPMAMSMTGTVRARLPQNRRLISTSSGFSASSSVMVRGSKAIPHLGQLPGSSETTSGCMGQIYSTFVPGSIGVSGSKAIPHFGQLPGPICRTSGHIGQM